MLSPYSSRDLGGQKVGRKLLCFSFTVEANIFKKNLIWILHKANKRSYPINQVGKKENVAQ